MKADDVWKKLSPKYEQTIIAISERYVPIRGERSGCGILADTQNITKIEILNVY